MASMPARIIAVLLLLLVSACASRKSKEMAESQALKNEATPTRLKLEDFVTSFSTRIEQACDEISQEVDDPSIRRNTVYFKMRVVPLARRTLDLADEQAVIMDLWLYSVLVGPFAASDDGKAFFGTGAGIMLDAGTDLESSARAVARVLMTPEQFQSADEGIAAFVASHGIDDDLEPDPESQDDWSNVVTSSLGKSVSIVTKPLSALNFTSGLSDTAIAVHQAVAELDRTKTMVGYLPSDLRWQTQLLLLELEETLNLPSLIESVAKVSDSSVSLSETAKNLPQEITTILDEVDAKQANLQKTLADVDTLITSTDATAKTLGETGDSLTRTLEALNTAMITILGPPPDPDAPPPPPEDPDEKSEPFDITEYGDTAARVTETATALTAFLAEAKALGESPAAPALIEDSEAMARGIVNQVFLSGGLFVLFTAVVMLSYRLLAAKLRSRD